MNLLHCLMHAVQYSGGSRRGRERERERERRGGGLMCMSGVTENCGCNYA